MDTVVHNSKHLLGAVVPGIRLCVRETLSKLVSSAVVIMIFYSLYCGILIDIDDIVVCWRTLETKEFKSLGKRL